MKRHPLFCFVVGLLLSIDASALAHGPYVFKKIADSSTFNFFYDVAINDAGTVAFGGDPKNGLGTGIYTGNGGPITTVVDLTGQFQSISFIAGNPINNSGVVAFTAYLDSGGAGVFTSDAASATTIALLNGSNGSFTSFGNFISINSSGSVAFTGFPISGGEGVYVGAGDSLTTIAHSDGPLNFSVNSVVSINDSGTVAFDARTDDLGWGIYTGSGGALTTVADSNGPFARLGAPSINSTGAVAFAATLDFDAGSGLYRRSGDQTVVIADTDGPLWLFGRPFLDDGGAIAFTASVEPKTMPNLYTGSDPIADKVLAAGDSLFGSTLRTIHSYMVNAKGDVAFRYSLMNGESGVAVASLIPEPAAASLALLSCLSVLVAGRASRRS